MTSKLVAGIAAGTFVLGILTGSAGTIALRDASSPTSTIAAVMTDHMTGADMGSMMSGSMMSPNSMGPDMMGPDASAMPGNQHDLHHPLASTDPSR